MDRLVIEITGTLPEKIKYSAMAAAETLADTLALELQQNWNIAAKVSVRAVRHKVVAAKPNGAAVAVETVHVSSSEAGHG
jgi:hypothetical protein